MSAPFAYAISYGKVAVPVYRAYAAPLRDLPSIPESSFTGRPNILFATEIDVEIFGADFLPSYTHGDNSMVVATDTMKNFILRESLSYQGATLEGLLDQLGRGFLAQYPVMPALRISGRELPFVAANVPQADTFAASDLVFSRSFADFSSATLDLARSGEAITLQAHRCGRQQLLVMKVTGSAFTRFQRDDYTTLPERGDRPLFIALDLHWTYGDPHDMLAPDNTHYIAAEQVRDVCTTVFHQFVSESIQHLVHEMGLRLLERFPQMASISFDAQNRTRDPIASDGQAKVFSDPFPAYGQIRLTMTRT
jgi:urate oxidase